MSPEPLAADRTYLSLKRDIIAGKYAPGASFNLQRLAEEFGTSITPVRDAIHRMVGERLLGVLQGGGFHLPVPSAEELRQLYAWHDLLIRQAVPARFAPVAFAGTGAGRGDDPASDIARQAAAFFDEVAAISGNRELMAAVANASERLSLARLREPLFIKSMDVELDMLVTVAGSGRASATRAAFREYHRRRLRRVDLIVRTLRG